MKLIRKFVTVGGATLISRILGFVRDILIAATIATGPVADAFFVAFRLPNLFRRLFAEGAFSAAFIPLFTKELENNGNYSARKFAEEILAILFWSLLGLTVIAEIFAPAFVFVLAPGFYAEPEKFDLAVLFSRITFPYLICMSVLAFISGILNSFNRFAAAAFVPVLLNIIMIILLSLVILLGLGETKSTGIVLSFGVMIAGLVQVFALAYVLKRQGFLISFKKPVMTHSVRNLLKLGIPGLIAGGITQINIAVGTIIASAQAGAISYLYYADRIFQLPLGVVGIAIGTVLLPSYSRSINDTDKTEFFNTQNRSLEFGLALTLPASVALFVIPEPIITVLFERGAFDSHDTLMTTRALAAFGIGLPAFILIKLFSPGFFAREDTKTPMWFAAIGMIVNVIGSLILFQYLGHVGIALATSIAGWINAALLMATLYKQGYLKIDRILRKRLLLLFMSSIVMGLGIWLCGNFLESHLHANQLLVQFGALALLIFAGLVVFAVSVQLTGALNLISHVRELLKLRNSKNSIGDGKN